MLNDYAYNQEKVRKYREFFHLHEGQKVVIGVGLLFERKGLLDFIEVARKMKDVTFIWFGSLNKLLCTHKINKAIKNLPDNMIMPGYIDGDVIKGAMTDCSCFFFPSYEETEGIVALEALASKTPLLIRDIPVYEDWLEDGISCYKGHNNEEFIEKINYILNHNNQEIIENGYAVVKERSIEKVGKQLVDAYQEVIQINKNK
jgi:1,2-diacylglycerol-3-alpha-glucose alpha-1,2-glucosyltransferase